MTPPDTIKRLVDKFDQSRDHFLSPAYNETQLRREFLDPFFEALGWDIANRAGTAEAYKEVIHEDSIRIGGGTKAPDYGFRIGKDRKFFVEAKKPAINIRDDVTPAFQLRRYAWTAKLPVSVLTDFQEFAVYDCRIKPLKLDKAATARINLLTYQDYLTKWDELHSVFSRDAVWKGSFDRYVVDTRTKKGTDEVDDAFLKEIESWRSLLARNIALRNPKLTVRELNFAVQRTIDRIIFLRICEDRGVETYGSLQALMNGERTYKKLCELFYRADEKYNSGLFHFSEEKGRPESPDELTLALRIDDKPLKEILGGLYYPDCSYEFSVLPADILGQVYEQFLGKVIRLTAGHQAKVEEKSEVKKAGGVFYTPTYIVDYIVANTVGKLVEGKTPKQVADLRILDPACGSGSFLIGAYQFLLDWHRDWYTKDNPEKWAKGKNAALYRGPGGDWRLTTAVRKEILLNNIYGVDIDSQAVEVTKLSLLLKVLEGESEESVTQQLKMFQTRALPDLGNNIKCGNSLIGPDFFEGQLIVDPEERSRINAFDWNAEFREIMARGGFDAVIGNPPYGATFDAAVRNHIRSVFAGRSKSFDSFELLLLRASALLSAAGYLSMIIPSSWMTGEKHQLSRRELVNRLSPVIAYAMPFDVFKGAYIDTAIVVFSKLSRDSRCLIHYFEKKNALLAVPDGVGTNVEVCRIRKDPLNRLSLVLAGAAASIMEKVEAATLHFGDWFTTKRGVQPYSRAKHTEEAIAKRFLHSPSKRTKAYLPELQGNELSRYWIDPERKQYLKYCDEIASSRPLSMFQGQRIVLRRLLTRRFRLQASTTSDTMITTDNVLNAVPRSHDASVVFALGLLNSRFLSWLYVNTSMIAQKDDFPQVHIAALDVLPIPSANRPHHDKMVSLVEQMLTLHVALAGSAIDYDKSTLRRQIDTIDKQIDALVYELYGLTEEEIRIVEGTT